MRKGALCLVDAVHYAAHAKSMSKQGLRFLVCCRISFTGLTPGDGMDERSMRRAGLFKTWSCVERFPERWKPEPTSCGIVGGSRG